jgi:hypothetical protein
VSIAEIARRLELNRKIVRRWLGEPDWEPYRRPPRSDTLLAPHAGAGPRVGYSAQILFRELRQRENAGSCDTVKLFVRPLRLAGLSAERAPVRFETPHERGRLRSHVGGQAAGGRAAPLAIEQASRPFGGQAALCPVKLSDAQVWGQVAFGIGDLPGDGGLQQARPGHFLSAHREGLPCLPGVTLSSEQLGHDIFIERQQRVIAS